MLMRGAPLIGAAAAYGMALARATMLATRRSTAPTPCCSRQPADGGQSALGARAHARRRAQPPARRARRRRLCQGQGDRRRGRGRLRGDRRERRDADRGDMARRRRSAGLPVNVLTHCNAGWLATVDWGTALAPIFKAHAPAFPSMSGSTRRARATRAPASPPGSSTSRACRTPSSPTTPAGI